MAVTDETLLVAAATRARLNDATLAVEVELTRAWVNAWDSLSADLQETVENILARTAKGERVPRYLLTRDERLRQALAQVHDTILTLVAAVNDTTVERVRSTIVTASDDTRQVLTTQAPPGQALPFVQPDPDALDAIIARSGERIVALSKGLPENVMRVVRSNLMRGITVGDNPRTVAARMVRQAGTGFDGGLARAMTIARTEMLDAYRQASTLNALANKDLIVGRRWLSTLSPRTCPSCLSKHGEVFPPDTSGPDDHPNGRCAFVDVLKPWSELGFPGINEPDPVWADRDEWWDTLHEDTKRGILGPGKYRLMADGDIGWADLSVKRSADGWRDSYVTPPLAHLVR